MFSALSCHYCIQSPSDVVFESCDCGFSQYCSLECKAAHWKEVHGLCCPTLTQLRNISENLAPPLLNNDESWFEYRRSQLVLASLLHGGQLPQLLQNSVMWQQICSYCFRSSAALFVCSDCSSVCYCEEHKAKVLEAHRQVCGLLRANQRYGGSTALGVSRCHKIPLSS